MLRSLLSNAKRSIFIAIFLVSFLSFGKVTYATVIYQYTTMDTDGEVLTGNYGMQNDLTVPSAWDGKTIRSIVVYQTSGNIASDCGNISIGAFVPILRLNNASAGGDSFNDTNSITNSGKIGVTMPDGGCRFEHAAGRTIHTGDVMTIILGNIGSTLSGSAADTLLGSAQKWDGSFGAGFSYDTNVHDYAFMIGDDVSDVPTPIGPTTACVGTLTQICSITPNEGDLLTGPTVDFSLEAYINPDDIGTFTGITISLHNIDQNVLLLSALSQSDITFYDGPVTSSGDFNFSTSSVPIANGNYRIEACLSRSYFGGWLQNPFANTIKNAPDCQSHQFIVGEGTFIGDASQNGYRIFHELVNGTSTATTTVSASTCSFWYPATFNIFKCGTFLFVPDTPYLNNSIKSFRDGVLTRVPWGYFTRMYTIMNASTTVALPTYTVHIPTAASTTMDLSFNPGDTLSGGAALMDSIHDPYNNKTLKDASEDIIKLVIYGAVVFTIYADLAGSHKHHTEPQVKQQGKT